MKNFIASFICTALLGGFAFGQNAATQTPAGGAVHPTTTTTKTGDAVAPTGAMMNASGQPVQATTAATATVATPPMALTTVKFSEITHEFGKIKQGEVVKHQFKFTNTGTNPLKIENARASCGCTTPNWTKEEVAPGKTGVIDVEFNSAGKEGQQSKTVTVTLNSAEGNIVLNFTGEVVK